MAESQVWVFFYGSYINREVLREASLVPAEFEVARLAGFDIVIRPRANLLRSDQHSVYGVLATALHEELRRLYRHAEEVLGEIYFLVETLDGRLRPALCYIAPAMESKPGSDDYIDRIITPAREYGVPEWYIERRSYAAKATWSIGRCL